MTKFKSFMLCITAAASVFITGCSTNTIKSEENDAG